MKVRFFASLTLILILVGTACGGNAPAEPLNSGSLESQSADEASQIADEQAQDATPTPFAEPTVAPTVQETLPPPQLSTPVPPTAVPTAEAPAEPTAPPAITLVNPEDFGDNRNPLTGEIVDPALLQRRPLAIKVSNSPPLFVRPQSGLNKADIVFEHITEGNLTRFTLIVYGDNPSQVGPIRSARLIDAELPAMYDAGLVYSGASTGVNSKLFSSDFAGRIIGTGEGGYFRTGEDKPTEHTLYGRPDELRQVLAGKGENRTPAFGERMNFSSVPPEGGRAASEITLDFKFERVSWRYDPETNRYYRTAGNVPHNDGLTGEQVSAANIVVPFANHVDDPNVCEEIRNDQCYLLSVEVQLWGQGDVVVFRDGQRYDGTWRRENRNDMLTFYDGAGNEIPLQIGNSWIEVMSIWYDNPLIVAP
ncbi:MAG: DUF3048 domain-containing protein [Chloroflexota bacterium]